VTSSPTRPAVFSAAALVAALLLAACSGGGVHVAAPSPTGAAAKRCAALRAVLPATLLGEKLRGTSPASADTAAWGSPAITLRCGVGMPGVIDPHSPAFDPTSDRHDVELNKGVCWVSEQTGGGGFRFTTVKQDTYVEVDVPGAYAGQQSPLASLAGTVLRTDPTDPADPFDCA
jgi:hypothetical protein